MKKEIKGQLGSLIYFTILDVFYVNSLQMSPRDEWLRAAIVSHMTDGSQLSDGARARSKGFQMLL